MDSDAVASAIDRARNFTAARRAAGSGMTQAMRVAREQAIHRRSAASASSASPGGGGGGGGGSVRAITVPVWFQGRSETVRIYSGIGYQQLEDTIRSIFAEASGS